MRTKLGSIIFAVGFVLISLPNGTATIDPYLLVDWSGNGRDLTQTGSDSVVANPVTAKYGAGLRANGDRTTELSAPLQAAEDFTTFIAFRATSIPATRALFEVGLSSGNSCDTAAVQTINVRLQANGLLSYCHSENPFGTGECFGPLVSVGTFYRLWVSREIATNTITWNLNDAITTCVYEVNDPFQIANTKLWINSHTDGAGTDTVEIFEFRFWNYRVPITVQDLIGNPTSPLYWGTAMGTESAFYRFDNDYAASEVSRFIGQSNPSTGAVSATAFTFAPLPTEVFTASRLMYWQISATYTAQSIVVTGGGVSYQFQIDGANIASCVWTLNRGTLEGMRTESNYLIRCPQSALTFGAHTWGITLTVTTGTNPVLASRIDVALVISDTIADSAKFDSMKQAQQSRRIETNLTGLRYTNGLINASLAHTRAQFGLLNVSLENKFSYTNGLINSTTVVLVGNLTTNNTEVIAAMHNADVAIGMNLYAIAWLLVIAGLIFWAEKTKDVFLYILAVLGGMSFVIIMWDEIVGLRFVVVAAMIFSIYRGYLQLTEDRKAGSEE
jgi:hypothetical protein